MWSCVNLFGLVLLWPGLWWAQVVACSWVKHGGTAQSCHCPQLPRQSSICYHQFGTFPWSLPAILKLFTLLVTLFLKCLFVFTVLLNQTTFSWFICHMIGFILPLSSGRFYFPCYFSRQKPTVFSCSHGGAFSPLPLALQLSESQDIFTQLLKCGGLFWCFCNIVEGGISHTPSKSRLSMVESLF